MDDGGEAEIKGGYRLLLYHSHVSHFPYYYYYYYYFALDSAID